MSHSPSRTPSLEDALVSDVVRMPRRARRLNLAKVSTHETHPAHDPVAPTISMSFWPCCSGLDG